MELRLGELVCGECGYFELPGQQDEENRGATLRKSASTSWKHSESFDPTRPDSAKRAASERLFAMRRMFLIGLAVLFPLSIIIVFAVGSVPLAHALRVVVVSTLFWIGVAALLLYADWVELKRIVLWLLLPVLVLYGYEVYRAASNQHYAVMLSALISFALTIWLGLVLIRDVRLNG